MRTTAVQAAPSKPLFSARKAGLASTSLQRGRAHRLYPSPPAWLRRETYRRCIGHVSCSVQAANKVFGDPISGTRKRLKFTWE